MEIKQEILWIWIKESLGFNNKKALRLINDLGSVFDVYDCRDFSSYTFLTAKESAVLSQKDIRSAYEIYGDCEENQITILTLDDPDYPPLLKEIENPPSPLFCKGHFLEQIKAPTLTVVGTRKYTGYGEQMTKELVFPLSSCGFSIVCGVADGIDFFVCDSVLRAGNGPIAVIPFGILYGHALQSRQYKDILAKGSIVSEVFPRNSSHKFSYHERNRILSGLSLGTLIIEAPAKSGALMTANYAIEQNRDVFALMANANSKESEGSNKLIKDGCYPVTAYTDILRIYLSEFSGILHELEQNKEHIVSLQEEIAEEKLKDFRKKHAKKLSETENAILSLMDTEPRSTDFIIENSHLQISDVLQGLTALEYKGLIVSCPGSKFKVIL